VCEHYVYALILLRVHARSHQEAILAAPSQQSDPTAVWISDVYLVPDYESHGGDQEAVAVEIAGN